MLSADSVDLDEDAGVRAPRARLKVNTKHQTLNTQHSTQDNQHQGQEERYEEGRYRRAHLPAEEVDGGRDHFPARRDQVTRGGGEEERAVVREELLARAHVLRDRDV